MNEANITMIIKDHVISLLCTCTIVAIYNPLCMFCYYMHCLINLA